MNIHRIRTFVRSNIGKRVAIAVPLSAIVGITLLLFGVEQSVLTGILITFLVFIFVDLALLNSTERACRIHDIQKLSKENTTDLIKYSLVTVTTFYFFNNYTKSSDPLIGDVQRLVEIFGLFAVLFYPLLQSSMSAARSRYSMAPMDCVSRMAIGVSIYSLTLWMIGEYGVAMKEWVLENPTDTSVYSITLILIWAILKLLPRENYSHVGGVHKDNVGKNFGGLPRLRKPTQRDNKYTAAHETGHALVYTALGSIPPKLEIVIKNDDLDGSLGFVTGIDSIHELNEKTFAEWIMLVLLAGQMGEEFAFGENTLGSTNDHERWLGMARCYLSNHYKGIFYPVPANQFEQELNEKKLTALQNAQKELLREMFEINTEVFKKLSQKLLETKRMGSEDIIPFLKQVSLPKEFPTPLGNFKEFGREWPSDIGLYSSNDTERQ